MELKVSSPKPGRHSPSDFASDPEDKEISDDDDDDDRNHKHRRRETRSQSLERDTTDPVINRSFRKSNKSIGNRHLFRGNDSEGEALKAYNKSAGEKEFSSKFERKRVGLTAFPRTSMNSNQRIRRNQVFSGEHTPSRARGRDAGSWNLWDNSFSSINVAPQLIQHGSVPPSIYIGRGLPNVSDAQTAAWNGFGLIPGIPNGGLDMLHSINLQAPLIPPINSTLNIGLPRQRCRDFEERGFCLRGDMCPMEHGLNRIVIEDVQSLSQFNLPVSLPSGHLVGTSVGSGPPQSMKTSTTLMDGKGVFVKGSKPGTDNDNSGLNGAIADTASASGADFYDPDQPLWNNTGPETSNELLSIKPTRPGEPESFISVAPCDRHHARLSDITGSLDQIGTSSSVWARVGAPKSNKKEKANDVTSSLCYPENSLNEVKDELAGVQGASQQGKQINEEASSKALDTSSKNQTENKRNFRKLSQKAQRTLFVSGVPQKSNKQEALLSHFQKFGEVIDIHIPLNSERAFVQFSKREEAEAALKAPDAVMGNRFIKLWWANRDNIPDDGAKINMGVSAIHHSMPPALVQTHAVVPSRVKDAVSQLSPLNSIKNIASSSHVKPILVNGPKVTPPLQKKLQNLEQLKEEIRKKQQMLDLKRNDFRRQLNKLEKHSTGPKGESVSEQEAKRLKVGNINCAKSVSPRSSDSGCALTSRNTEIVNGKRRSVENNLSHSPKTSVDVVALESTTLKQPISPLTPARHQPLMNKHKSEEPSIAFRIIPPLPDGLADDAALRSHFSSFGDLSGIELENMEMKDAGQSKSSSNCSARISFSSQLAADKAFIEGTRWRGHHLKFMWLTSSNPDNELMSGEDPSAPKCPLESNSDVTECVVTRETTATEGGPTNLEIGNDTQHT